jgi:hypothetical protein
MYHSGGTSDFEYFIGDRENFRNIEAYLKSYDATLEEMKSDIKNIISVISEYPNFSKSVNFIAESNNERNSHILGMMNGIFDMIDSHISSEIG